MRVTLNDILSKKNTTFFGATERDSIRSIRHRLCTRKPSGHHIKHQKVLESTQWLSLDINLMGMCKKTFDFDHR